MKNKIKAVKIPSCENHEGLSYCYIRLRWVCPICGKPRGKIKPVKSYDGSLVLCCDGWDNPCGHIDFYENARHEATTNGLNTGGGGG